MSDKVSHEAAMERRHELLAEESVDAGCVGYFTEIRAGMVDQLRRSVAQAIANAEAKGLVSREIRERLAAEKAWDEGYAGYLAGATNPYCHPNPKETTMAGKPDDMVTVCDSCLRACCWKGIFMCDDARDAGTVERTVQQCIDLGEEHSDYWDGSYERQQQRRGRR